MKKTRDIKYSKYLLSVYARMTKNLIIDADGDLCKVSTGGKTAICKKIAAMHTTAR